MAKTLLDRFEENVFYSPDGCWYWIAGCNPDGYGMIRKEKGKQVGAHRVSFNIYKGTIPNGLHVLHKCDNRKCVNPDHLFLGTHQDNMNDMIKKGRLKTFLGSDVGTAKLAETDVPIIRSLYKKIPNVKIAEMYNVSSQCIDLIMNKQTWKHI